MRDKKASMGRIALVFTTLIWGTSFVILKNTLDSILPMWIMSYRFTLAALVMLLLSIKRLKTIDKEYLKGGAVMGLCLALSYIIQTYGLYYTTPGKNAFLTATYCVIVPFFNWMILGRKPNPYNVIAAFVCMFGVGFVFLSGADGFRLNLGDILSACSGAMFALHIIATDKYVADRDPLQLTMIQFAVAAVVSFVGAAIFEPRPTELPTSSIVSILYLGILCTGICFFLQTWGQKYTSPTTASIILMLEAVFGTLVSLLVGQETMSFGIAFGFSLIFFAILISETKPKFLRKKSQPER